MEKPILFNTEMVKAILDGRKTMTRRIIKPQPIDTSWFRRIDHVNGAVFEWSASTSACVRKLPYQVGDILWVRETWQQIEFFDYCIKDKFVYKADKTSEEFAREYNVKWHPSIHMPRAAARLFLRVKNVRVERLQDITEEDARAEGCFMPAYSIENGSLVGDSVALFQIIWDSTIKKQDLDKYGWDVNPWVWVIEFEKVKGA